MKTTDKLFRFSLAMLYAVSITTLVILFIRGLPFYLTPLGERPFHPDYGTLRPAGRWGLLYGIAGTAMMLSLLLYSVRKRTRIFGRAFRLKHWLDVHILFGIMGPLLILLHTSFKLGGLVAISFWSMVAVAMSGVLGRYLYTRIPRNIMGGELTLRELESQEQILDHQLNLYPKRDWQAISQYADRIEFRGKNMLAFLFWLMISDIRRWHGFNRISRRIAKEHGTSQALNIAIDTAKKKAILRRNIQLLDRVNALFHQWHVIHRPFAIVMYLVMFIHIIVAILFGISWKP